MSFEVIGDTEAFQFFPLFSPIVPSLAFVPWCLKRSLEGRKEEEKEKDRDASDKRASGCDVTVAATLRLN